MNIKFMLADNKLTPDPKDQRAIVMSAGKKTMEDVIRMAEKRGTLVTRTDMIAVSQLIFEIIADFVAEGHTVITPLCNLKPSIRGTFADVTSDFDTSVNEVVASLTAGVDLKKKLKESRPEKVTARSNGPMPVALFDKQSDTSNELLSPGGMGMLVGSKLGYDKADAQQGIFLIDGQGSETRVVDIAVNRPSEIIFKIPDGLPTGVYRLWLRSTMGGNKLRSADLEQDLEVQ